MIAYYLLGGYFLVHIVCAVLGLGMCCFKRVNPWKSPSFWAFAVFPFLGLFLSCLDVLLVTPYRTLPYLVCLRLPLCVVFVLSSMLLFVLRGHRTLQGVLCLLHLLWGWGLPWLCFVSERFELFLLSPIVMGYWPSYEIAGFVLAQVGYSTLQGVVAWWAMSRVPNR